MPADDLTDVLLKYIQEALAPASLTEPINDTSPLLEMGVLDSLKTAMLLNFIRERFGTRVPSSMVEFGNFRDVRSISAMVDSLLAGEGRR
jgi:acyl carrier protein